MAVAEPDLSSRPLNLRLERVLASPPHVVFEAWTTDKFAKWFAAEGTLLWKAETDAPLFFETFFEGERHPHYGRFLRVVPDRLVELTWLTTGTKGAETVLTVEVAPADNRTLITLTHAGFPDQESRDKHREAWVQILDELDNFCRGQ